MNTSLEASLALSIEDVLPIVDAVVAQMSRHLPSHVSSQDLASAGKLALMEVLSDFNGSFAQDRGYVVCRVRGAVLDEMRRLDPLSRHSRSQVRLIRRAVAGLEIELNRTPTDREIAAKTTLTESAIGRIQRLGLAAESLSSDVLNETGETLKLIADSEQPSPADLAEESDSLSNLRAALGRLSNSQSIVLQNYYFNGLTLQEIAGELGLSTVRVHQLKASAETRLRTDPALADLWFAR